MRSAKEVRRSTQRKRMSRKYRHQGYQDSGGNGDDRQRESNGSPPRPALTPEERIQRRSLRHATAREATVVVRCPDCGRNVDSLGTIGRESNCPHCNAALHCCRTCRFFDTSARWQCRAEIAAAVAAKSKANDCTAYSPRLVLDSTGRRTAAPGRSNDPRAQFDNLFKR
jgi:hypothetical protein